LATAVYVLCALTAGLCAWLLGRAYLHSRARLLLWSCICFIGLCLNNVVLFVDKVVAPDTDLSAWRLVPAAVGIAFLLYGLIWEVD
jgi:phosphoglycerol transferase MdoB-like AlkP superfamily enzyme